MKHVDRVVERESTRSEEADHQGEDDEGEIELVAHDRGVPGEPLGERDRDHRSDHVTGDGEARDSSEDPDANRDAAKELDGAVEYGKERRRMEVGLGGEVDLFAVESATVKRAEQRAGTVVDENPGEANADDQKSEVPGK